MQKRKTPDMTDCCTPKPAGHGRYDLAVVGAGSAGFSAAITADPQMRTTVAHMMNGVAQDGRAGLRPANPRQISSLVGHALRFSTQDGWPEFRSGWLESRDDGRTLGSLRYVHGRVTELYVAEVDGIAAAGSFLASDHAPMWWHADPNPVPAELDLDPAAVLAAMPS